MASERSSGARVTIRGVPHYYEWVTHTEGESNKPVLVFLHGWGGSARYWRPTAVALADRFDCLLYDLRGFGRSPLPAAPSQALPGYALEDYVQDLAELLDALGLERAFINGHSTGASVALLFAHHYPERVERTILTCSGIFPYNRWAFSAFHWAGRNIVRLRFNWFRRVPGMDRLFMARFLQRPIPAAERRAFLEDYLAANTEAAAGTIRTAVSRHAAQVMPQAFAGLRVPTLLVSGEKDIIIPNWMGQRAAALNEGVTHCELPQTAHFPMLEDAPRYLEQVRVFLGLAPPAVTEGAAARRE